MKTNAPVQDPPSTGGATANTDNLERTRELLFGPALREIEKRFGRLEERLSRELNETKEEFRRRLGQLEVHTKSELESITNQLAAERDERNRLLRQLATERQAADSSLEEKIAQHVESSSRAARDLASHTRDQHRLLTEEMQQKFDSLSGSLARESAALRDDKTDRAALADMLSEMALRLRREVPDLPTHAG